MRKVLIGLCFLAGLGGVVMGVMAQVGAGDLTSKAELERRLFAKHTGVEDPSSEQARHEWLATARPEDWTARAQWRDRTAAVIAITKAKSLDKAILETESAAADAVTQRNIFGGAGLFLLVLGALALWRKPATPSTT